MKNVYATLRQDKALYFGSTLDQLHLETCPVYADLEWQTMIFQAERCPFFQTEQRLTDTFIMHPKKSLLYARYTEDFL